MKHTVRFGYIEKVIVIRIRCEANHVFLFLSLPVLESNFSEFLVDRAQPSLPSKLQGFDTERQAILPRKSFDLDTVKCRGHTYQSPHPCPPSAERCLKVVLFPPSGPLADQACPLMSTQIYAERTRESSTNPCGKGAGRCWCGGDVGHKDTRMVLVKRD